MEPKGTETPSDAEANAYKSAIFSSIDHFDYDNALFLSERFAAAFPHLHEPTILMAKTHYLAGSPHIACRVLESTKTNSPAARFLYALCCFQVDRLTAAEKALTDLLAEARSAGMTTGILGTDLRFGVDISHAHNLLGRVHLRMSSIKQAQKEFKEALRLNPTLWSAFQNLAGTGHFADEGGSATEGQLVGKGEDKTSKKRGFDEMQAVENPTNEEAKTLTRLREMMHQSGSTQKADGLSDSSKKPILPVLQVLGDAYVKLSRYHCIEALDAFQKLPGVHYNTAWVLTNVAKAHYELAKFSDAIEAFKKARIAQSWQIEHMDIYGSSLWHVRDETALSRLAHELNAIDRLAPQTWCVMGNLESLKRQPERAIKCLTRAVQLSGSFAYSHMLLGAEYMDIGDNLNAIKSFQKARTLNPRSFGAWYGLGRISYAQGKFKVARQQFARAMRINPRNPILHCYLGIVFQKEREHERALECFEAAINADPKVTLYRFRKAYALAEALECLKKLEGHSPEEGNVYFLRGSIYKAKKEPSLALEAFTKAVLYAKDDQKRRIKATIEKLNEEQEDEKGSA
ncbi:hypothetical protein HK104_000324 [Borealophlyctis nickersoniae]|nr:hypothetical protein HK104_000324 [Borealophlyctis nickersoniae]